MTTHSILVVDRDDTFTSALSKLLMQFNAEASARAYDGQNLAIKLVSAETQEVVGGLLGSTSYGYLHIDAVFVPVALRGTGIGRELVLVAEAEALGRGCIGAWLDTFSFQAPGFYEKLGYSLFAVLHDNPPGHTRHFFKKSLTTA